MANILANPKSIVDPVKFFNLTPKIVIDCYRNAVKFVIISMAHIPKIDF